jgi:hypothetical protein
VGTTQWTPAIASGGRESHRAPAWSQERAMANSKYKAAEYLRRGADHEKRAAEQTLIQI